MKGKCETCENCLFGKCIEDGFDLDAMDYLSGVESDCSTYKCKNVTE